MVKFSVTYSTHKMFAENNARYFAYIVESFLVRSCLHMKEDSINDL
jgi:hypothetical protein